MSEALPESDPTTIATGDGRAFRTGLLVPQRRVTKCAAFADAARVLDRSEILDIINDVDRVSARQLFPQAEWAKNQGNVGSCNGWAAARALGKSRVKRGLPAVHLSGSFVYAHINGGRDRGSILEDGMEFITDVGACPESLVPVEEWRLNRISAEAKAAARKFRALECYALESEMELASALALGFVGVVAVHVPNGSGFTRTDSKGRVPEAHGVGNHSVHVDDICEIDGQFYFDMDYDWGRSVGDDGKGWISWSRHLRKTVNYHYFYAIRSTTDGDE